VDSERRELQAHNLGVFMRQGPGLHKDYTVWIVAKCADRVCLGGLGAMGVGTMWVDGETNYREFPGYDDAPTVDEETAPKLGMSW
jgi:hypothetical protein